MAIKGFEEILDELNIVLGDVLFVHSSWSRLKFLNLSPIELVNKLKERLGGKGLLCMPTYPWIAPAPLFDPKKPFCPAATPSLVGYLTEIFRQSPGVYRSANPLFPIAATGYGAYDLVSNQVSVQDTFGKESVFERLLALKVKQVGLGVSVGLSTFIHMADWKLQNLLNFKVSEEVKVTVELEDKVIYNTPFLVIPNAIFKVINSKLLFEKRKDLMGKIVFKNLDGNFIYSYVIEDMLKVANEEAKNALKAKALPCWYKEKPKEEFDMI